jgi:putative nucleotidyltransferase with HDIG domain
MSASSLTLKAVVADFDKLPPAPAVMMQLLDLLGQEEVDTQAVARLITRDPVLAGKCLNLANSSVCGLQKRVSTITDALTVIGERSLSTLLATLTLTRRFEAVAIPGYDMRKFWLHSIATALCARALARRTRVNPESAFMAGLVHDIGKLVLATRFPENFSSVLERCRQDDCRMLDAETAVLGFNHCQIGQELAAAWNFTPEVARAVAGHHTPEDHPASLITSVVHLADVFAHTLDFASDETALVPRLSSFAWHWLALDWTQAKDVMAEVDAQRQDAELFFH